MKYIIIISNLNIILGNTLDTPYMEKRCEACYWSMANKLAHSVGI